MQRIYSAVLKQHLEKNHQMAFLSGPRQVGKTTISIQIANAVEHSKSLNWDITKDRALILGSVEGVIDGLPIDALMETQPLLIFDEIHKYDEWKNYLKGFIDQYKAKLDIIVTGSAKLNVVRRGGDSLMGRYFLYRIHPVSVRELLSTKLVENEISPPKKITDEQFDALVNFGGFPEPFTKQDKHFYNQWQSLRQEQMLKEDIFTGEKIQNLSQLQVLAELLKHQVGGQVRFSELAKKVRVADTTIRRWITILEAYYYCFSIKPYTKNVARSLIKEPKIFLWDWSVVPNQGAKVENFIASHLLKAVQYWTDLGFGHYDLFYLRDKDKHEVDFLITKDNKPWILIEVKSSAQEKLSKNLLYFQEQIKASHVFQLAFDMPYVDIDCFIATAPVIVSARTFLSQLI